ncbi:LysR family transcriptional regulator [Sulfitobacter albidus]|uniref:LysR family transcriptional regulator n=1 Tax=Sulfitobacter albidus TaxID=2829501 RepID=A0A975JEJ3_9RHOB|nr:LysR family transcriptional regulator [Sulfitobacter albidus]QUJ77034.1 LysR family transcriptional regulator [Sulfitobacter albidus]
MRNLDVATLRSFVAVAEAGGVTRAAGFLNLTQSAVSMQIKRLEGLLDVALFDRSGRGVIMTAAGDQLLSYARRMVALNDEVVGALGEVQPAGVLRLGVPHDIVNPAIPQALKQAVAAHPGLQIHLESSHTRVLKDSFARGDCDIILTTEADVAPGGETLVQRPLRWIGAPGAVSWQQRPVPIAFGRLCIFRPLVIDALNGADIPWQMLAESDNDSTIYATVGADLAIHAMIEGTEPAHLARIDHRGALPDLPEQRINLYCRSGSDRAFLEDICAILRRSFAGAPKNRRSEKTA